MINAYKRWRVLADVNTDSDDNELDEDSDSSPAKRAKIQDDHTENLSEQDTESQSDSASRPLTWIPSVVSRANLHWLHISTYVW